MPRQRQLSSPLLLLVMAVVVAASRLAVAAQQQDRLDHAHARPQAEPDGPHAAFVPHAAFPLTAAQAARRLAATRDYTLALAARLNETFEAHFPLSKRESGMTQAEFGEAARAMMAALSADELYTAGVSSRPGAVRPAFDWPWARSFKVVSHHLYFHMGWRRANKEQWKETPRYKVAGTDDFIARRPNIVGQWVPEVPSDCELGQPNFLWKWSTYQLGYLYPDGFDMHLCMGTPPENTTLPAVPKTRRRVTLCVHLVLYLVNLNTRLQSEWLAEYFRYYTALGVEHFYLYVSRIPFIDVPGYSYDWIDTTWMHAFKYSIYGQTWAANNCLHRNREQMNEWVLFVDIDELVTLPGLPGGLRQLAARLEEEGYESTSFHSVGYMPSYCTAEGEEGEAAPGTGGGGGGGVGLADRMVLRAPFPERCESIWQRNCSLTSRIATFGRRKVFVKAITAPSIDIHHLRGMDEYDTMMHLRTRHRFNKGNFSNMTRALNASRAWIKHLRGIGFDDVSRPEQQERHMCSGPPATCADTPAGVQCPVSQHHDAVAEIINPLNSWVDDRMYRLRARAMGDILAGSYDMDIGGGQIDEE